MFVGLYVCACAYICACVFMCMCVFICMYVCMYVCVLVCVHTHVCVCVCFLEVQKRTPLSAAQLSQFSVLSFILKASSEM